MPAAPARRTATARVPRRRAAPPTAQTPSQVRLSSSVSLPPLAHSEVRGGAGERGAHELTRRVCQGSESTKTPFLPPSLLYLSRSRHMPVCELEAKSRAGIVALGAFPTTLPAQPSKQPLGGFCVGLLWWGAALLLALLGAFHCFLQKPHSPAEELRGCHAQAMYSCPLFSFCCFSDLPFPHRALVSCPLKRNARSRHRSSSMGESAKVGEYLPYPPFLLPWFFSCAFLLFPPSLLQSFEWGMDWCRGGVFLPFRFL